jgi:hypothetical protein
MVILIMKATIPERANRGSRVVEWCGNDGRRGFYIPVAAVATEVLYGAYYPAREVRKTMCVWLM